MKDKTSPGRPFFFYLSLQGGGCEGGAWRWEGVETNTGDQELVEGVEVAGVHIKESIGKRR